MRVGIFMVGFVAAVLAIIIDSIYALWYLCADLVYVVLFPQLLCVIYFARSNTYGSLSGYVVGLFFRLAGGEPLLKLPALIHYPGYADGAQNFPFRSLSMLLTLFCLVTVSLTTHWLFHSGRLAVRHDLFRCVVNIPDERQSLRENNHEAELAALNNHNHHQQQEKAIVVSRDRLSSGEVNPALKLSSRGLHSSDGNNP